ncbi:AAA ATPase [Candidatus Magnetomorum sp. HK-1]|nr:AAA ATPase [Candidatus Magnetomorum sp. HK-1]
MKTFNTSGPCNPELHYTLIRENLLKYGVKHVKKGAFFTIFAPRQSGKTTYFQLLFQKLNANIKPIHIRFASFKTLSRREFYEAFNHLIHREMNKCNINIPIDIHNQLYVQKYFEAIKELNYQILLVIDEFEGIPDSVLSELMHTLRDMYHQKDNHALHSMILVGVSTLAELVYTTASPFNVADEIAIPYFSESEINELIDQYVLETGQDFEHDVRRCIFHNTQGQPGLVNALCSYLVEKAVTDRSKFVCISDFQQTIQYFLTEKYDKNITNVVQKAFEKKNLMLRLLFDDKPYPFSIHNPEISWLFANGIIYNVDNNAQINVPLYSKALIAAFRPDTNGESRHYQKNKNDNFQCIQCENGLNIKELLQRYAAYVKRRGFHAFDTENLKESAWHYSLDGFINFAIESVDGHTLIEVPTGRGRADIIIVYGSYKYVIETKIYSTERRFQDGKIQLAEYLKSEGIEQGFYVVFSNQHSEKDILFEEEMIDGKVIQTFIIRTYFDQPSQFAKVQRKLNKETLDTIIFKLLAKEYTHDEIMDITDISENKLKQYL